MSAHDDNLPRDKRGAYMRGLSPTERKVMSVRGNEAMREKHKAKVSDGNGEKKENKSCT